MVDRKIIRGLMHMSGLEEKLSQLASVNGVSWYEES